MRKIYFILIAMLIVIVFAPPDKIKAGTPGQISISDSRHVPDWDNNVSCAPVNSVDVTLTNSGGVDICNSCPEWYVSVWEWDGGTGYVRIGSWQPFSSGLTFSWPGLSWDYTNYHCLVLIWHYVPTGIYNGCGFSTPDQQIHICPSSPLSSWSVADFYPC